MRAKNLKRPNFSLQAEEFDWENVTGSLAAVQRAFGCGRRDSLAATNPNAADLYDGLAMAWIENNVFASRRIPWTGPERWRVARYGEYYRPGMVPPCPFSALCYDSDFLRAIYADLRRGFPLGEAVDRLPDEAERLLEAERDYRFSDECFLESADANGWTFDGDGALADD